MWKIALAVIAIVTFTGWAHAQNNRTNCEKAKAEKLAVCLGEATDGVRWCQGNCEDDPDDRSAYNECRRFCSNEEQKERVTAMR
jgi:hypothetical protein